MAGDQTGGLGYQEKAPKAETVNVQLADLIDTGDADYLFGTEDAVKLNNNQSTANPSTSAVPLIDDLFGGSPDTSLSTSEHTDDDDPFAGVSFHNNSNKEHEADIFCGMTVDKLGATEPPSASKQGGTELFDIFGSNSEVPQDVDNAGRDVNDMMASLSMDENGSIAKQNGNSAGLHSANFFPEPPVSTGNQAPSDILNSILASQAAGMNANSMFPLSAMPYAVSPGFIMNSSFSPQQMNYNAMGNLLTQQQLLATMSNFQQLGHLQPDSGAVHSAGSKGGYSSPLPDIFNPAIPNQTPTSMMGPAKKEETRAFDFISVSRKSLVCVCFLPFCVSTLSSV